MQWSDDGFVLGIRRHGETSAILELMTREHGRHLGLVRGGAGSRMRPVLQHGDLRLKNVLVEPDGTKIVSLIDWDSCASAPGGSNGAPETK